VPSPRPDKERKYGREAKRLAKLPTDLQKQIIALQRDLASNPRLKKQDREAGMERADALERNLRLLRKKKGARG